MKKLLAICIAFIGLHANAQLPSEKPIDELLPPAAQQNLNRSKQQSFSQAELPSTATFPKQYMLKNKKPSAALTQKELQNQLPSNRDIGWPITQTQKRKKKK